MVQSLFRNNLLRRKSASPLHGFTLIELLVVIAIISLLVSILLPSLQKAKNLARSVACAANVKALMSSLYLYAEDNKESLSYSLVLSGGYRYSWGSTLFFGGYVSDYNYFFCPGQESIPTDDILSYASSIYWTYTGYGASEYGAMPSYDPSFSSHRKPVTLCTPNASQLIVLVDSDCTFPSWTKSFDGWYEIHVYGGSTGSFLPMDRHADRASVGWLDGHVSLETGPGIGWLPDGDGWNLNMDCSEAPWYEFKYTTE